MTIITPKTNIGRHYRYPWLSRFTDWQIETTPLGDDEQVTHILSKHDQSLRLVKDKVIDITADGLKPHQFLDALKLTVSLDKGPFVLSKRLSRLFRPYRYYAWPKRLDIHYDSSLDVKQWDGAGLVSQAFVDKLGLDTGRVEYTIMSERGQDKGHALVVDGLDHDFILPCDTKTEVKFDGCFVGLLPVESHDHMNLDVQSHINLHPFYRHDDLKAWLEAEAKLFLESIQAGTLTEVLARITDISDMDGWWVKEYLASGGDPMWFASVVKALASQHARKITNTRLDGFKLPVPGGRYYVFSEAVRRTTSIPAGHCELDPEHGTIWLSQHDWVQYAEILGGMDSDDGLWVQPFTDHDNIRKILTWRSPNQLGELLVLLPTEASHEIQWVTADNPIVWPPMDSRLLPARIDAQPTTYGSGIKAAVHPKGLPYSINAMNRGVQQMQENAGVLGATCNLLMVTKALWNQGPKHMPAKLGDIIDASQKTGDNLKAVMDWVRASAQKVADVRPALPQVMHHRIINLLREDQSLQKTHDHWLDQIVVIVQTHIHGYQAQVQALMNTTMPPLKVLQAGTPWLKEGAELRSVYSQFIRARQTMDTWLSEEDFDQARELIENHLSTFPADLRGSVLLGALTRVYLTDRSTNEQGNEVISDTFAWMLGAKTGGIRLPGVAHTTMEALRKLSVLQTHIEDPEFGLLSYTRRKVALVGQPVEIVGVWFAPVAIAHAEKMSQVPRTERDSLKALVHEAALEGRYTGQTFTVVDRPDGRRQVVGAEGPLGLISKHHHSRVGTTLTIHHAVAKDGNLSVIAV